MWEKKSSFQIFEICTDLETTCFLYPPYPYAQVNLIRLTCILLLAFTQITEEEEKKHEEENEEKCHQDSNQNFLVPSQSLGAIDITYEGKILFTQTPILFPPSHSLYLHNHTSWNYFHYPDRMDE